MTWPDPSRLLRRNPSTATEGRATILTPTSAQITWMARLDARMLGSRGAGPVGRVELQGPTGASNIDRPDGERTTRRDAAATATWGEQLLLDHRGARTLKAGTGLVNPLSVYSPIGSISTMSSTSAYSRWSIRICPPDASAQSRAARFVTEPIAA